MMFTKVIVTILLWCWFYSGVRGKEESFCSKILLRKSYYNAAERMIAQVNVSKGKMNYIYLCGAVTKFTYHLFQDPEALLCAEPIRDYVINREKEFKYARVKCKIARDVFLDLACEPEIHDFHTCIQTHLKLTLKGLARKEKPGKYACAKCREAHFVKLCSANIKKQRVCKKLYYAINSNRKEGKSCEICVKRNDLHGEAALTGVKSNGGYNVIIVASVVGGILLIPAAVVVFTYIWRRRKNNKEAEDKTNDPDDSDVENSKSLRSRATKDKTPSRSGRNCAETDFTFALSSKSGPSKVSNRH